MIILLEVEHKEEVFVVIMVACREIVLTNNLVKTPPKDVIKRLTLIPLNI